MIQPGQFFKIFKQGSDTLKWFNKECSKDTRLILVANIVKELYKGICLILIGDDTHVTSPRSPKLKQRQNIFNQGTKSEINNSVPCFETQLNLYFKRWSKQPNIVDMILKLFTLIDE